MGEPIPLTWNEALSGVFGSISLASWVFVLLPQLAENYKHKSAEGISLTFLLIWFIGDVANLVGAIWANLVPMVIAIAVYYCFTGIVLITQCVYYNILNGRERAIRNASVVDENQPLLGSPKRGSFSRRLTDVTDDNIGLPGSRRRSSNISRRRVLEDDDDVQRPVGAFLAGRSKPRVVLKNTLAIFGIIVLGTAGWAITWRAGIWRPIPVDREVKGSHIPLGAEILGYVSAVLYLGARIPQIVKNQREKSCDGLSLLFFMLSLMGNATYGAGILFHSVEKDYFIKNLPWLIGSLGTIVEDITVFVQFSIYGERSSSDDAIEPAPENPQGRVQ